MQIATVFRRLVLCIALVWGVGWGARLLVRLRAFQPELRVVVMDPLTSRLACACIKGYAQRDYGRLGDALAESLGCNVSIGYAESMTAEILEGLGHVDVVIGKVDVVEHDAPRVGLDLRRLLMLTGKDGLTTEHGIFAVRGKDPARSLDDLEGYRLALGPVECPEKHAEAMRALSAASVHGVVTAGLQQATCARGALAVMDGDADACVIASHAMPLLTGCGVVASDELRGVGRTVDVPFVGVFVNRAMARHDIQRLTDVLLCVEKDVELLEVLESKRGFVMGSPRVGDHAQ